ncbi:MAG TPA: cation diffusion facilitator family transporter [Gammaproteobacteria bacterium]|nr:cation diffusion facilitator family transporter [Gammaproteobacteria bacterium]HRP86699.1 cation diffusion facilitator family transporter [Gammaproteobacteria bacterium]
MQPDARRARLLRLATTASVATAAMLVAAKLGAWLLTGSVSLLASLVDSMMDVLASAVNLAAVRWSLLPPDEEHRFGHGKAEALAGLGQAAFIAGSALFLLFHVIDRLLNPQPLEHLAVGLGIMAFSMVATALLIGFQRYVIRHTGSLAIRADSLHYLSDLLTNAGILLALGLVLAGWAWADPLIGLAVAAYILWSAIRIGLDGIDVLMDRELPAEDQERIVAIASATPGVLGVHDVRTRQSGATRFIQLHLELPADLRLAESHALVSRVQAALLQAFPDADVMIHQDPVAPDRRPVSG